MMIGSRLNHARLAFLTIQRCNISIKCAAFPNVTSLPARIAEHPKLNPLNSTTRGFRQLTKHPERPLPILKPEMYNIEPKHAPIERDAEVRATKPHRLSVQINGFEPSDIKINAIGCQVTIRATRQGVVVDGSRSNQEFEYVCSLPQRVDCKRLTAFFDPVECELHMEAPFIGEAMLPPQGTENFVKLDVGYSPYPNFDLNAPLEQKIPTPGDDDFPRDIPVDAETEKQVFSSLKVTKKPDNQ